MFSNFVCCSYQTVALYVLTGMLGAGYQTVSVNVQQLYVCWSYQTVALYVLTGMLGAGYQTVSVNVQQLCLLELSDCSIICAYRYVRCRLSTIAVKEHHWYVMCKLSDCSGKCAALVYYVHTIRL